jgi:hypothetical protein
VDRRWECQTTDDQQAGKTKLMQRSCASALEPFDAIVRVTLAHTLTAVLHFFSTDLGLWFRGRQDRFL